MKVYSIFFSPGGSTKKCVLNVASGFKDVEHITIDMNDIKNRSKDHYFKSDDLVIIGMPTMTKLFGLPSDIVSRLYGDKTPFVGLVTCGNGYYGKGLIALNTIMTRQNFRIVGAGGFVGQYSFNKEIAKGRPDDRDKVMQVDMGRRIQEKLLSGDLSFNHKLKIDWPREGAFSTVKCGLVSLLPGPGGELPKSMRSLDVHDTCVKCKKCIKACPVGAITFKEGIVIDNEKCIGCFACGNTCPVNAIHHTNQMMIKSVKNVVSFRDKRKPLDIFI
ncbi:4Fe-4S dicluster domain-containing protein [Acidaminobacter sp. JC074]|uniref:4Fe-4S binding protein n=1 Tax=Acidaminobacter sp. JC074 TaxID=2530199 RepID=UPI001F0F3C0E|nr:4Fe-4S binding protein [Acidaminobacter sp. JC074]MCH4886471.1 4Fe-4S dicluster domain-containing protein [Acidaminobacter sp. JC074]